MSRAQTQDDVSSGTLWPHSQGHFENIRSKLSVQGLTTLFTKYKAVYLMQFIDLPARKFRVYRNSIVNKRYKLESGVHDLALNLFLIMVNNFLIP